MVGQRRGVPGGALEEVVVGVEAVTVVVVGDVIGLGVVGDASQGVVAQAHDPAEQELAGGDGGGVSEGGGESIDEGGQRRYHSPHGRGPLGVEDGTHPQT